MRTKSLVIETTSIQGKKNSGSSRLNDIWLVAGTAG